MSPSFTRQSQGVLLRKQSNHFRLSYLASNRLSSLPFSRERPFGSWLGWSSSAVHQSRSPGFSPSAGRPAGRLAFPAGSALSPKRGADSGQLGSRDDHVSSSWPNLSFKDTCRFARSLPSPSGPCGPSSPVRTPLMGFKDRPSASTNAARPLRGGPKPAFRPGGTNLQTRSALVVPPDSDGFLRAAPCRSIAPCNRPWGSPCFRGLVPSPPEGGAGRGLLSRWRMPFEAFPSLAAVPCRHGSCPLVVGCRFRGLSARVAARFRSVWSAPPTSGLFSTRESVATASALPPRPRSLLPWAWILSDCVVESRAFRPRRADSASAFAVTPEGVTGPTPATGLPVRQRRLSEERRWRPIEFVRRPEGRRRRSMSTDAFEPRWAGEPPLRGGLAPSSPGRPSAPPLRRRVDRGILGNAAGRAVPPRRAGGPALRWFPSPEGDGGQRGPGGPRVVRGKPRAVRFSPGIAFPKKGERSHRVDSTRRERPLGSRAEARLSEPRIERRERRSAALFLCGSRVCAASAEAPLVRLRGPLRELPERAEACWVGRLGSCRCSARPEGRTDPRAAPRRRAGPTPSRGTEVLRASCNRRSSSGKARSWLPRAAKPRKALRRSASSSLSLFGPKPGWGGLTVRKRTGGGRVPLSSVRRTARTRREGAFLLSGSAEALLRLEEARIRPERMWSRQRTFRLNISNTRFL
jgi:hypothetical protein